MTAAASLDPSTLWQLARLGAPSLCPDGAQAVCALTQPELAHNRSSSALWLLSTLGGAPRRLTSAGSPQGKDGNPRWSPRGDHIAFIAQREQEGVKDEAPQLYLIPPDGGEARRLTQVPSGVEDFKWFPDGRRIAFIAWVFPQLKGQTAQAKAHKQQQERKDSAYVTEETLYRYWDQNLPMGRVPHLLVVDVDSGRVQDLFEGSAHELRRAEPSATDFDISPDGRRIVFVHDPHPHKDLQHCHALAEIELRSRQVRPLLQDPDWDLSAPVYSHAGQHLAFLARHQARRYTMPEQVAVLDTHGHWAVLSEDWDHSAQAPLRWDEDDLGLLFCAEHHGRAHLWRLDVKTCATHMLYEGGHCSAFDLSAGTLVLLHDSALHPSRLSVLEQEGQEGQEAATQRLRRIESFNDTLLQNLKLGRCEEQWFKGAQGDDVQMWVTYPPGFSARRQYPLLHVIHGGPHTAMGDSWHWRWNAQVLAAQGYVVAAVNYHGSSSFGFEFQDSITGRWGQLELQDIEAATDTLLRQPYIDAKRLYASGGSYGGYMVAWMNAHLSAGRYQAYVCHAGVFDWQAMHASDAYTGLHESLGARYWEDPQRIAAQSAHGRAQHLSTPTLVVHGQRDFRVPDAQGLAYYNTLKSLGVSARLLWFPDENHWVMKPANSVLWYQEIFDWLGRHSAGPSRAQARRPRSTSVGNTPKRAR
ncbi:S9 family peptidase [Roseateles sp. BYS180W]|uniref:Acyl-peptide hydrolase n=1 Tax=Roseateles rivi TaxID=3299028 RepID=A0ABW7FRZ0_9BURK